MPFVDIHDIHMRVRDIFHDGEWHFEDLYTQLPPDIQLSMKGLFIEDNAEDMLIWGASNFGVYTAKCAHS